VFLLNSRLSLVAAIISSFRREVLHPNMTPLLPKLRGYFAEFLRESYLAHLGILYLTTCVGFGYGHLQSRYAAFLGSMASTELNPWVLSYSALLCNARADLPTQTSYAFGGTIQSFLLYSLLRPDLTDNDLRWYGNINPLCIDYAFRPRLSPRLTPRGRTGRGNP
jgi:hypothetical protein